MTYCVIIVVVIICWKCLVCQFLGRRIRRERLTRPLRKSVVSRRERCIVTYSGVIDASQLRLGAFQHEEGGQIGSVRSYDDHSKPSPHHAKYPRRKTARCAYNSCSDIDKLKACKTTGKAHRRQRRSHIIAITAIV